jgi:hypothetical protein
MSNKNKFHSVNEESFKIAENYKNWTVKQMPMITLAKHSENVYWAVKLEDNAGK